MTTKGEAGPAGKQELPGAEGPERAILDLVEVQVQLASAVADLVTTQEEMKTNVRILARGVHRLVTGVVMGVTAILLMGAVFVWLGQAVRTEGNNGRQNLKCVVAVLFRQDPPRCPGAKEHLIKEGILPAGFPVTTTIPVTTSTRP